MLARYTLQPMRRLWGRKATKFGYWQLVELAVLSARAQLGQLPAEVVEQVSKALRRSPIRVRRIEEIEKTKHHDLVSFVIERQEALVRAGLGEHKEQFHRGMTSYDTEDPATILMLRAASDLIIEELRHLQDALTARAVEHKWTPIIARTHAQYAQPSTFGHLLLVYAQEIARAIRRLEWVRDNDLAEGKLSGAVGIYTILSPEVERIALASLGLTPAPVETQILQRDRHAAVISMLAVAHASIEQIARTFHVMMHSAVGELQEPRGKGQAGSSAMGHKRNPHNTEQMFGLPRLTRGFTQAALEDVAALEFRDISQSSVERHIFPDATGLVHYSANKMAKVVSGLVVFPDRMQRNLDRTFGTWASQRVMDALFNAGIGYDAAYSYIQWCSFQASDQEVPLQRLLRTTPIPDTDKTGEQAIGRRRLQKCFDVKDAIRNGVEQVFRNALGE